MGSIFGGSAVSKSQAQQKKMTAQAVKQQKKMIGQQQDKALGYITAAQSNLQNAAGQPLDFSTPGYGIHMDSTGGFINRTGESQGFMDALKYGLGTDEAGYTDLLSQITPGFGRLSKAQAQEIENAGRAAVGGLREQLARRRVLGASFANDQLSGLQATYDQMKEKALAEAFVQEMEMTKQVISSRTEARNATIAQAMSQIQFETDAGKQLSLAILANNQDMARLQADLASTAAQVSAGIGTAGMGNAASLQNTMIGSQPEYAQMAAAAQAAPYSMLGSALGMFAAPVLGGAGTDLGTSLFGNQVMNTASNFFGSNNSAATT